MKRHSIGKFEGDELVPVGSVIINDDNSYSVETDDPILKERFKELEDEDIIATEGIEGINKVGHPSFIEVDEILQPLNPRFIVALEKYLPKDYGMMEIYYPVQEKNKTE